MEDLLIYVSTEILGSHDVPIEDFKRGRDLILGHIKCRRVGEGDLQIFPRV